MTQRIGTPDHDHSDDGDGGPNITPTGLTVQGWEWVDLAAEDVTLDGSEDVSADLEELVGDGTLLVVPDGSTLDVSTVVEVTDVENFGVWSPGEATFTGTANTMFKVTGASSSILFENLTRDATAAGEGGRFIGAIVEDDLVIRNCDFVGLHDDGGPSPFRAELTTEDGVGVMERCRVPDGMDWSASDQSAGLLVATNHVGELYVRQCHIENCEDGLYGNANPPGAVHVEGGVYRNNGVNQIRLNGEGSTVRDATAEVNADWDSGATGPRGIRFRGGHGHVVEDTIVKMGKDSMSAIVVASEAGACTIRDTRIEATSSDWTGRFITAASYSGSEDDSALKLEGVNMVGTPGRTDNYLNRFVRTTQWIGGEVNLPSTSSLYVIRFAGDDCVLKGVKVEADIRAVRSQSGEDRQRIIGNRLADTAGSNAEVALGGSNNIIIGNITNNGVSGSGQVANNIDLST